MLCKDLIQACLHTCESQPIPAFEGFYLACQKPDKMSSVLYGQAFYGIKSPAMLLRFAIVGKSRHAVAVWKELHAKASWVPKTSVEERVPGAPFIAVSLERELEFYPDALVHLGNLERCLAWAWVNF